MDKTILVVDVLKKKFQLQYLIPEQLTVRPRNPYMSRDWHTFLTFLAQTLRSNGLNIVMLSSEKFAIICTRFCNFICTAWEQF